MYPSNTALPAHQPNYSCGKNYVTYKSIVLIRKAAIIAWDHD